jgi:hypothetical protein
MKLEPKHLVPYLPYNLKFKEINYGGTHLLCGIIENELWFKDNYGDNYNSIISDESMKPTFHQLSDFQEEHIEEIKEFLDQKWCEVYDDFFDALFEHDWLMHTRILMCPYEILQWFFKNHYDVFGLIEENLAIDINTLNK